MREIKAVTTDPPLQFMKADIITCLTCWLFTTTHNAPHQSTVTQVCRINIRTYHQTMSSFYHECSHWSLMQYGWWRLSSSLISINRWSCTTTHDTPHTICIYIICIHMYIHTNWQQYSPTRLDASLYHRSLHMVHVTSYLWSPTSSAVIHHSFPWIRTYVCGNY